MPALALRAQSRHAAAANVAMAGTHSFNRIEMLLRIVPNVDWLVYDLCAAIAGGPTADTQWPPGAALHYDSIYKRAGGRLQANYPEKSEEFARRGGSIGNRGLPNQWLGIFVEPVSVRKCHS